MTALRREAIQLMEQMPEEQMPNIIRYMHTLKGKTVPVSQELDYDRELEQARDERYGHID